MAKRKGQVSYNKQRNESLENALDASSRVLVSRHNLTFRERLHAEKIDYLSPILTRSARHHSTLRTFTATMESLNLNMLANSLPTSNLANAEKDLTNNFKGASCFISSIITIVYQD